MRNDPSSSTIPPPLSLNDGVVDGELDIVWYYIYKRRVRRDTNEIDALNAIIYRKRKAVTLVSKAPEFNSCIGSTDVTHIGILCCANWAGHNSLGHKFSVPSRTYKSTVRHWRQIIGTTCDHPATWNDKTIIIYDNPVRGVNDGVLFQDNQFSLLKYDQNQNLTKVIYKGAGFMVYNGYLLWSCTVPPMIYGINHEKIHFRNKWSR